MIQASVPATDSWLSQGGGPDIEVTWESPAEGICHPLVVTGAASRSTEHP